MQSAFLLLGFLILTLTSPGQLPKKAIKKIGQNPALFLDSTEVDKVTLQSINAFDISNLSIIKPKRAKKLLGDKGTDGAIYVTTVKSAKQIYWTFLSGKSEKYKQLITSPFADTVVQYIVNGDALTDSSVAGTLFFITEKNFKSLDIIDKEDGRFLMDKVYPKRYIVVIRSKRPKGLVKK